MFNFFLHCSQRAVSDESFPEMFRFVTGCPTSSPRESDAVKLAGKQLAVCTILPPNVALASLQYRRLLHPQSCRIEHTCLASTLHPVYELSHYYVHARPG